MPTEITLSRLRQYQAMRDRLIEAREREFAPGRAVRVMSAMAVETD